MHVLDNAELMTAGNRFSRALDSAGVPPRGGVAIVAGNVPEYLAAYRATQWSGRRFTPMSWRWSAEDVAYVVGNCAADALVAEARHADLVTEAAELVAPERRFAIRGSIPGFQDWSVVDAMAGDELPHPVAGSHMMYTSGTTGRPKGVLRPGIEGPPPGQIGRAGREMLEWCLGDDAGGSHLVCTPLYHAAPLTYADGAALLGAQLVLLERFDAETVLQAIETHRIRSTFMVPTQFVRLLRLPEEVRRRYDVSSLRLVVHGAAPVAPEIKRAMIDWFGPVLFEFYGGTEGGGLMITSQEWLDHPGAVGRPRNDLIVEIRDDDGRPLPTGATGQVWFGGYTRFEYQDDPDKTAETWDGDHFTLGDIGYVDDDGYLYLCDRRADVIISGGVNIYPAQVEAVLLGHPAVGDCCVVGVPDDEWGETVLAVVQPSEGFLGDDALAHALLAHCRAGLPAYQVPRAVDFDPALPRTETGKLGRRVIRERYWAGRDRRI
ncbi:MAG: long-chain acyl-CoA synthetase [Acidimicrobiia bacterium]